MSRTALVWLALTVCCIAIQGIYSMLELAAVSFNRVRLQYYVSKKVKRAIWLRDLLFKPSRLFGTVMLGVNIALQIGSQTAREFYSSLGLDPDLAPITQVFLVVIFAELTPLFAARRYPEHVVMLGMPLVYITSQIFAPVIWLIDQFMQLTFKIFGKKGENFELVISREELQKVLETHEEANEFNIVISGIFALKNLSAEHVMTPLDKIDMVTATLTVGALRKFLNDPIYRKEPHFVPLYHQNRSNIVAIAHVRDLVLLSDQRPLRAHARTPWFITSTTKLMPILSQFRNNQQTVAVVLDPNGSAIGLLTLDAIFEEIFGEYPLEEKVKKGIAYPVIHRIFPGNTKIADFNREYNAELNAHGVETFAQLMVTLLDHPPVVGDTLLVDHFELTVEEASLLGIKSVIINTLED
jgi:putative hemolysin